MRAAAVQLTSTADRDRNLATADRLTRAAAAAGAELVVLPEKWAVLGTPEETAAGAEPFDGPALRWASATARELGIDLVAGSIAERVEGAERGSNTSVHFGPDGEEKAVYRKVHMFDVEVGGKIYRESENEAPGEELVVSETAGGVELGLSICYDLRFPELYRILAVRGARVLVVPGRVHARHHARALGGPAARPRDRGPGVRGRRQPGRRARPGLPLRRALDDRRPVGRRARAGARHGDLRARRARPRAPGGDPPHDAVAGQPPPVRLPLAERGARLVAATKPSVDKRRIILDAAVRVFARQGFHTCRVSDIADEAGVAYGLVYHYFGSKDEVLDTLFLERWGLLLEAIAEIDRRDVPARDKLHAVASFIVDSYRHDPELMKVIIVEVTRAANSFGAAHLGTISDAYRQIQGIVEKAQASGEFRTTVTAQFAAMAFYGAIEQVLTGWIFGLLERGRGLLRARQGPRGRDGLPRARDVHSRAMTDNDMVKRLAWAGLLAGVGALASIVTTRVAAVIYRRMFGEDPPE